MRKAASYASVLVVSALLLLAAVAGGNALVDPFGIYRWVEIPGFNAAKPAIYHRVRLLKAYEVRRLRPDAVVLGSSRVHLGIRPSHPGWSQRFRRPYNLGFDGATTKEMYHYLVHAQAAGPLRQVLLGLDTYHLSQAPGSTRPGFDAALLLGEARWRNLPRAIAADLKLLISAGTLRESLDTLLAQDGAEPLWLAADGQRLGEVFFRRPEESFQKFGPRHYFDEIDKLEVGFQLEWRIPAAPARPTSPASAPAVDPVNSLGYIAKILAYCRRHGIDLHIFLTPSHVHQLELSAATGAWPALEDGKRALVELVAADARHHAGREPVPVWDFSGYSTVTTEPLPAPHSRAELNYYWDSSHFKDRVGDWVLDRLLGTAGAGQPVPDDFGRRLTPQTVEPLLAADRDRQAAYRRAHAEDIRVISQWVSDYKRRHGIRD